MKKHNPRVTRPAKKRPKLSKAETDAKGHARMAGRLDYDGAHDIAAIKVRARERRVKRRLALAAAMGITLLPWPGD